MSRAKIVDISLIFIMFVVELCNRHKRMLFRPAAVGQLRVEVKSLTVLGKGIKQYNMKRTFEFNDEKSSKFWSIETNNNELSVTFGKIGTNGQSQTKSFASEEACAKEAEKLIREKTKKGYVEQGADNVAATSTKEQASDKNREYPFYFFGSGVRKLYDEDGDRDRTYIKFIDKPSVEQVRQIMELAPKAAMLKDGGNGYRYMREQGLKTPVLELFSEYDIYTIIADVYGNGTFSDEACEAFSKEIDTWIMQVHEICPIQAVVRDLYDKERNIHTDWHKYSIENADALLDEWHSEPKEAYKESDYDFGKMVEALGYSLYYYKRNPKYSFEQIMSGKSDENLMTCKAANKVKIDKSATASEAYYELTNSKLVPLISTALTMAIRKYKELIEEGETDEENISVELDSTMKFYLAEDECEGKPFFKFKLGAVYKKSMELQKQMEADNGTGYRQAISNLFEDAYVDESEYGDLSFSLWVPETGGDPFIENI